MLWADIDQDDIGSYEIIVGYSTGVSREEVSYKKNDVDLNELKQSFLKRFGNLRYKSSNKSSLEYDLVRGITYQAKSIEEWQREVNDRTRWSLEIKRETDTI